MTRRFGVGDCWPMLAVLVLPHLCAAMLAAPGSSVSAPDIQTIMQRSSEANEADWKASPAYVCKEKVREPDGTKTYADLMIEGSPYQRLIAVNDRPLSADEQQKEE